MKLNFYINNVLSPPPRNWKDIEVEVDFTNDNPSASISSTAFEFVGENAVTINNWINAGITGGVGIFEGIPFRIETCDNNLVIFDGCLDTASAQMEKDCDIVRVPIKEGGKIDFLNDTADSFTFAYLRDTGAITQADYIDIPYVVSSIPDYGNVLMLSISTFVILKETYEVAREVAIAISDLLFGAAAATATAGVSIAWQVARVVAQIAYLVLLIIALINLIQDLFDNIIQPVKYKKGMRVIDLCNKGAAQLGKTFSSTILQTAPYNELTIVPRKIIIPGTRDKDEQGNANAYGHFDGTFGDLLRALMDYFNAKIVVRNNVIYLERVDFWNNITNYVLPDIKTDFHGTNASELAANYFVTYQLDEGELNTYDDFAGTNAQMILRPNVVNNPNNVLLKNLVEKRLAFAMMKRKTTLTKPEIIFNTIVNIAQALCNAINTVTLGSTNLSITVPSRIGMLHLSSDFIGVPKIGIIDAQGYVSPNNYVYTAAITLLNTFHVVSFGTQGRGNQYLIYKEKLIPLCCKDFTLLSTNNVFKTVDNKNGKMISFRWKIDPETAVVTYKVQQDYTTNLTETIIADGQ